MIYNFLRTISKMLLSGRDAVFGLDALRYELKSLESTINRLGNTLGALSLAQERRMEDLELTLRGYAEEVKSSRANVHRDLVTVEGHMHHQLHMMKQTTNLVARKLPAVERHVKVLFLVSNIEAWDSLAGIHEAMLRSQSFEPIVVSINRRFPPSPHYVEEELIDKRLTELGVEHIRLGLQDSFAALDIVKSLNPTVIFRQTHSDADVPPGFVTSELRFARLCYVPYEMTSLVRNELLSENGFDPTTDNYFQRSSWRIFCGNQFDRDRFLKNSTLKGHNVVATGHPKAVRLTSRGARWPLDRGGETRFRLLWSAHHSIGDDWYRFGMFHRVWKDMIAWAENSPDIDFVFTPHPALRAQTEMRVESIAPGNYDEFLARWSALRNTSVLTGGDYGPVMAASDALLIDGISQMAEYQLFDKPTIFLEREDHVAFNDVGELVRTAMLAVANVREASEAVARLMAGEPDPRASMHASVAEKVSIKEGVEKRILDAILLGLVDEGRATA